MPDDFKSWLASTWPQLVIMTHGAIALIARLVLVFWQAVKDGFSSQQVSEVHPGNVYGLFGVQTHFVGVMVLNIGALLMIVGYLAGRPWGKKDNGGSMSILL